MSAGKAAGWALLACAASALLFFRTGQAELYGSPKLLAMAVCAAAAWAALLARSGWRRTPLDAPAAALLGVYLASTALSPDPFIGLVGGYSSHAYGLAGLLLCGAAYYAAACSDEPRDPDRLLVAALWAAAAAAAYGLLQKAGVELFAGVRPHPSGRLGGPQGDPVLFGACLMLFVPVAARYRDRAVGRAAGPLIAAALFFTLTRGAWLGAAAGLGVYLWLSGRVVLTRRALALSAALSAGLLGAALLLRPVALSDSARVELWRSLAPAVAERPLLGSGPDTVQTLLRRRRTEGFLRALGPYSSQVSAHNDLLQVLVTLGLAGLAAYLWLLAGAWRLLREALSDPKRRPAAAAVAGALAGLFVQAKFNPVPLSALALAGLMLGTLASPAERPGRALPLKALGLLVCAGLAVLALRLCRADRQLLLGRSFEAAGRAGPALAAYRAAVRLNPYEFHYRLSHARFLARLAAAAPPGAARLELYEEAVLSGREGARLRPWLPDGHALLGTYLLLCASEGSPGRLEEARAALEAALERDPFHPSIIENRLQAAEALRETARASELRAELSRLIHIKR